MVERALYGNVDWSVGTVGVGSAVTPTRWTVAEGSVSGFDTYVLVANPGATAATATVSLGLDTGGVVTTTAVVPALGRVAVSADAVAGVSWGFTITVTADQAVVVERAMYWPSMVRARGGRGAGAAVAAADDRGWDEHASPGSELLLLLRAGRHGTGRGGVRWRSTTGSEADLDDDLAAHRALGVLPSR